MTDQVEAGTETAATPETAPKQEQPAAEAPATERAYSQSELDRIVTKALETNRAKIEAQIREEAERKRLESERKYKELWEQEQAQRQRMELQAATARAAADLGMPALSEVLDSDLTTIEGRKAAGQSIKALVEAEVERRVAERLRSDPPPKQGPSSNGAMTPEAVRTMSMAEYEKARREGRIK